MFKFFAGGKCERGLENVNGVCKKPEPCGYYSQKCCGGDSCHWGLVCDGGSCTTCGWEGKPTCDGVPLSASFLDPFLRLYLSFVLFDVLHNVQRPSLGAAACALFESSLCDVL